MELVNLFAFRSESIKKLKERVRYENVEPVGDLNNQYLIKAIKDADKVMVAWGSNGGFQRRDKAVLSLLKDIPLFCFNKTSMGKPEYPKRIKGVELIEF
ncbi:hypothetical protein J6TS1_19920 [Siminovitchia terrae]|uniref:DUF1643 domain-containing protein n=2 Tax=Siminovitchia terrae TaxID=1914933 RepID=A0ABQ4KVR8_SIMTE|nr:hypothetical protein J6TS1_19920 [Siminovitchia terrae]